MVPIVDVFTSFAGEAAEVHVGTCRFSLRRGRISCSFAYSDAYLKRADAYAIDPALPLRSTFYHCEGMPGAMRDSSPDRWGRHLIDRRAIAEAQATGAALRTTDEIDYLLGVFDSTRQGALRYSISGSDERLSVNNEVPPIIELKRLLFASNEIARGNEGNAQVKELLDAGSGSLGGARPKASVIDEGKLLLAKFSHPGDEWDVMAWEKTALDIAGAAGMAVPSSKLVRIGNDSVLLLERFDRIGSLEKGDRIPYLSAMSLVGAHDGDSCDYANVADALSVWTADPCRELAELFRRIVLSVALHNTDDHLRNLGFVRKKDGWTLAPVFDVNINPAASCDRVTALFGEAGKGEVEGLDSLGEICGLKAEERANIVRQILAPVRHWRAFAKRNGCKDSECDLMGRVIEERCAALESRFAR